MKPGSVFVMCSTVDPNWSVALERGWPSCGLLYLDAPISGGAAKAASGPDDDDDRRHAPRPMPGPAAALDAMAAKVYRLGDRAGNGSKVKIINQLLAGVHIAAAAEAMALGLREGVDAAALYEVITHSAGNSWMFENRMAHVLAGDYTPLSAVDIFVKDLGLVLDTARATKFPLPLSATAHQMFMQASTRRLRPRGRRGGDQDLPRHRAAGQGVAHEQHRCSAASPTTSPARPTSPTTWCAPACARCRPSACRPTARCREADAVVVALKSRTIAAGRGGGAVAGRAALAAARRARSRSTSSTARPSTSTPRATSARSPMRCSTRCTARRGFTIACPAFPENQRTVFKGHLFVGDMLLSESGMRHHPLTPMTDANLVRVLQAQAAARSGWSRYDVVAQRPAGDPRALRGAAGRGRAHRRGRCGVQRRPDAHRRGAGRHAAGHRRLGHRDRPAAELAGQRRARQGATPMRLPPAAGLRAVVSGSCSLATNAPGGCTSGAPGGPASRSTRWRWPPARTWPRRRWTGPAAAGRRARCWSTPPPSPRPSRRCRRSWARRGRRAGRAGAVARSPRGLVERGVRQLVVAGGETSGAVVQALGVRQMRSARRSTPACPGRPRTRRCARASRCTWR